jgi:hypothetical protein
MIEIFISVRIKLMWILLVTVNRTCIFQKLDFAEIDEESNTWN